MKPTLPDSYEAPAVERHIAPEQIAREAHYAGTTGSDPQASPSPEPPR